MTAVDRRQRFEEQFDIVLKADFLPGFIQVLFAHSAVKFGIVKQEVCQFGALLDQIQPRHSDCFTFELVCRDAEHLAEHISRIVKAQGLIKITCKDITFECSVCHTTLDSHTKM